VIGVYVIEQRKRVGDESGFGGFAGAAAVAAVVHGIERAVGISLRQGGQAAADVFGVTAEVNHGIYTGMAANADENSLAVDIEDRGRAVVRD
jgi:hypothetical protein